jgi:ABC-type Fe3+-siderophore transport system permease subunit
MSVIFLIVPMFALTYIQPTGYILLAAALFSTVFAVVAAICSRARNHEVFAVTAAYAAVIMVFVGNSIQGRFQNGSG